MTTTFLDAQEAYEQAGDNRRAVFQRSIQGMVLKWHQQSDDRECDTYAIVRNAEGTIAIVAVLTRGRYAEAGGITIHSTRWDGPPPRNRDGSAWAEASALEIKQLREALADAVKLDLMLAAL